MNPSKRNHLNAALAITEGDLQAKLKWLMFFRLLFTSLLLGSTILLQTAEGLSPVDTPLLLLYALICAIFVLTVGYALYLPRCQYLKSFALVQVMVDTMVVSLIILVTGSYSSIFSFLYLLVIIYASILLDFKATMIVAAFSSLQYFVIIDLEFLDVLKPFVTSDSQSAADFTWQQVHFKIVATIAAFLSVAFLSNLLSEQTRKTKRKLLAMEERVKRMEKMAAVGEMGAGLAHEIKNPLASLTGSIQLLREDIRLEPFQDKLMQIILREADRLSSLVNSFLLFAKPPAGNAESIDLGQTLTEILALFQVDQELNRGIKVHSQLTPDLWVEMDPDHLRQIIWNLLKNAAEAIQGQGNIWIKVLPAKNDKVLIMIRDDGCGLTDEVRQNIFDPFFTTRPKGTGLGLSIVHSILESYQTWLEVDSEVGQGAIFSFHMPRINPPS
jgi:two-component system sensor histidine kinase PilS (NtrC family)